MYPAADPRKMKLCKQIARIGEERILPLPPEQEALAMDIHNNELVFDMRLYSFVDPEDFDADYDAFIYSLRYQFGYEGIKHSGVKAFFDGYGGMGHGWSWDDLLMDLGCRWCDIEQNYPGKVIRAIRLEDIDRAIKEDKLCCFGAVESCEMIGHDLDKIDLLYGLGIRAMHLCYSKKNLLGDGLLERTNCGLSKLGIQAVERMNELGIIIDVCHTGRQTALEICKFSKKPVILSHTGAQKLYNTPRLARDEDMKAVADTGGVIGVHTIVNMLSDKEYQSIEDPIGVHLDYMVNLVGIDHVGIGCDNHFGDKAAWHRNFMARNTSEGFQSFIKPSAPYVDYFENPSEWRNITRMLVKKGYSREDIVKIIGGNFLRVCKEVLK